MKVTQNQILTDKQKIEKLEQEIAEKYLLVGQLNKKLNKLEKQIIEVGCSIHSPMGLDFKIYNNKAEELENKIINIKKCINNLGLSDISYKKIIDIIENN